jgi:nucleoid-associated protein YgaU
MELREKYQDVVDYAGRLPLRGLSVEEQDGKLVLRAATDYELDRALLFDRIRAHDNWEQEVAADIRVLHDDILGLHTVMPGETLVEIAERRLGDASRYAEIFELNRDILADPDRLRAGQKLRIPRP